MFRQQLITEFLGQYIHAECEWIISPPPHTSLSLVVDTSSIKNGKSHCINFPGQVIGLSQKTKLYLSSFQLLFSFKVQHLTLCDINLQTPSSFSLYLWAGLNFPYFF